MTVSSRPLRHTLMIGASLISLSLAGTVQGQGISRVYTPNAVTQATQNAATQNAAAQAAAARTRAALEKAVQARQDMAAAQAIARAAAQAAESAIKNGLGGNGLRVAEGIAADSSLWVGANGPVESVGADGRTKVTIGQTQEKAILTWDSFNVGKTTDLTFDQATADYIVLNRVRGTERSHIEGSINAKGSVYIINQNGILFGGASTVNVRNLIASSLDIHGGSTEIFQPSENGSLVSQARWEELKKEARDQKFMDGLFGNNGIDFNGQFRGHFSFWDGVTNATGPGYQEQLTEIENAAQSTAVGVTVAAGAQISTVESGTIMLIGRNVDNSGVISAPSGQVVLAAGRAVAFIDGTQRSLSGGYPWLGETRDSVFKVPGYISVVQQGGRASNDGLIETTRGNISLTGAAVIQSGILAATTGVDKAGSILLDASTLQGLSGWSPDIRGDVVGAGNNSWRGAVQIAGGSHILILPDGSGQTAPGSSFVPSNIEIVGNSIVFEQGSTLWAPSADLYLFADGVPRSTGGGGNEKAGRLYVENGAVIDVSGLNGIEIAMEQNSVRAEFRANELADNPVVRDGILRGETVYFDGRLGGNLDENGVANLQGWYDLIQRDVEQFMTVGGSISLRGAEIITREGSVIDLSGGSVIYKDGYVQRTRLIDPYGRLVPIEEALAGVNYVGIEGDFVRTHTRWQVTETFRNPIKRVSTGNWERGYVEGRSAGTLTLGAGRSGNYGSTGGYTGQGYTFIGDLARIFDGEVRAGVVIGEHQREANTGSGITDVSRIWQERPSLGTLVIGETYQYNTSQPNSFRVNGGSIVIADRATVLGEDFTVSSVLFDSANHYASVIDGVKTGEHVLSADWFDGQTFGDVTIHSGNSVDTLYELRDGVWVLKANAPTDVPGGQLTIGKDVTVDLGDYGSFRFIGRQAQVDGTIRATGGNVSLEGTYLPKILPNDDTPEFSTIPDALRPGISLGATGVIDVAGRFGNNWLEAIKGEALSNAVVDGGTVNLMTYNLTLAEGSLIDVSGAAHLATDGETLTLGDAGTVTLDLDTSSSIGLQSGGELIADGQILGHAPGKGGTLNLFMPWDIVISDSDDLMQIADGVLEAGVAAPKDVRLSETITLPEGAVAPFDTTRTKTGVLSGGETLTAQAAVTANASTEAVTVLVDWIVPEGVIVQATPVATYTAGQTVPAGTKLTALRASTSTNLPSGFVVPTGVFQYADGTQGLKLTAAGAQVLVRAGTTLEAPMVLEVGAVLPKGTVLAENVRVDNDFRRVSSAFFEAGQRAAPEGDVSKQLAQGRDFHDGFASFGLTGAQGLTIASGSVIAPTHDTLQLTGLVRIIDTGARLIDHAAVADSGVTRVNSADLPEWQTQATDLVFGSSPFSFDPSWSQARSSWGTYTRVTARPATLVVMEAGSEIHLTPESRVLFNTRGDRQANGSETVGGRLFVDGLIQTKGGEIGLQSAPWAGSATVVVGDNARLLAQGYEMVTGYVDAQPVRAVRDGGRITVGGDAGVQVLVGEGALFDVSGVAGVADLAYQSDGTVARGAPLVATEVHGAGGDIIFNTTSGFIAGELRLAPGGDTGAGGQLVFTTGSRAQVVVRNEITDLQPVGAHSLILGDALTLSGARINASEADDLNIGYLLNTPSSLVFDGNVHLKTRRSVRIGGELRSAVPLKAGDESHVTIESAYVAFTGVLDETFGTLGGNTATRHSLTVRADLIDLMNVTLLGGDGFATANFISKGDIRLISARGVDGNTLTGGLGSRGHLGFTAAQIYAAPGRDNMWSVGLYHQFDFAEGNPGFLIQSLASIEVQGNGGATPVPLTWGGKLTLRAPEIVQGGTVRAPLGTIVLDAVNRTDAQGNVITGRLTLLPDSLTSVSLEGTQALAGLNNSQAEFWGYWREDWGPSKSVVLSGESIALEDGAVVDLSGGGDLIGYSFASGTSGRSNVLDSNVEGAAFAILPGYAGALPVPVTGLELQTEAGWRDSDSRGLNTGTADARLRVGDQVWLTGVPGLADGYYTLLPAVYALLEGGHLIEPAEGRVTATPLAGQTQADGSQLVSGYRAVAGTAIRPDQGWTSFRVMNADAWRQYSAITTYSFNESKAAQNAETGLQTRTPHDAGRLVIEAKTQLKLLGEARLSGGAGETAGLAGDVDISNPGGGVALVAAGQAGPAGWLTVEAEAVQVFAGAGSLLLGGRRPITTRVTGDTLNPSTSFEPVPEGVAVTATATNVRIAEGLSYTGLELLLAATGNTEVGAGAQLNASGTGRTNDSDLLASGNGALLRLSSGGRVGLIRSGGTGASGSITIGSGTQLVSAGALLLDASAGFALPGDVLFDVGALDLASDRINIGDTPEGLTGTVISLQTIERLAGATDLTLRAHQALAVWGDFTLGGRGADGTATLETLTFDTPKIEGHAEAGEGLSLIAGSLRLQNSGGTGTATTGTGVLTVDVDRLVLGDGASALSGYASLTGRAGELVAEGKGDFTVWGDIDLSVGRVSALTGAISSFNASGAVALRQGQAVETAAEGLGGRFSLSGANVLFDTVAVARSGALALEARGGNVTLSENARLDVTGIARDFIDTVRYTTGGVVTLSASGDVVTHEASLIDVSGDARGGAAGVIDVTAGGTAALNGRLRAETAEGYAGGEFALDAGGTDFATLNALLNSGRFSTSRDIRLDEAITLAAGQRIEAHEVVLRSNGDVSIAGTIAANGDATHASGGVVSLSGANVWLESTGRIEAAAASVAAADYQPASGVVVLAADEGKVGLASGSQIDLGGGREGGGRLMVRARRTATGADAELNATVTGAREKILVGSSVYQAATINTALMTPILNEASNWLSGVSQTAGWETGAGIIIRSAGNLTVANDINLANLSGPGWLGLEAGGDLIVNANISDGFDSATAAGVLGTDASFSYGLESGADIRIGTARIVRTGTGDITVRAGRDLFIGTASAIYTAGRATDTAAGFDRSGYVRNKVATTDRVLGDFPTQGGNIRLKAGRDITGYLIGQTPTAWLFRNGSATQGLASEATIERQTSWSIVYRNYQFGVGALGGGDINVRARGDITDLAAAIPTTGHLTTIVGNKGRAEDLVIRGGGDLTVRAFGDIGGGNYVLGKGQAELIAGGEIGLGVLSRVEVSGGQNATYYAYENRGYASLFGLMDATVSLQAGRGVDIEGVYDLGLIPQICENIAGLCTGAGPGSAWVSYSERSALEAVAAGGDVIYRANSTAATTLTLSSGTNFRVSLAAPSNAFIRGVATNYLLTYAPGTLKLAAVDGDFYLKKKLILTSAPSGTLELLARGNLELPVATTAASVLVEPFALDYLRTAWRPVATAAQGQAGIQNAAPGANSDVNVGNNYWRGYELPHAHDYEPLRFYALEGSIGVIAAPYNGWTLVSPKATRINAGKDVGVATLSITHNRDSDLSTVIAGRDVILGGSPSASGPRYQIYGAGDLWVEAGRNFKPFSTNAAIIGVGNGTSRVNSVGNDDLGGQNFALADKSVNIHIVTGTAQGSDYDAFADLYLDPANLANPEFGLSHPTNQGKVVRTYEQELEAFLETKGFTGVNEDNRRALFDSLPQQTRQIFLQGVLIEELRQTGIDYNTVSSSRFQQYTRGYSALHLLYPAAEGLGRENPLGGDILLTNGTVESLSGGSINLIAPYGRVGVGNPIDPEVNSYAGVLTRRGGNISILANGTISLDQSRVFTLQGGDLMMWTSAGDITAGIGAKTSVTNVPLSFRLDNDGLLTINVFGLSTGAGIGVLDAFEGRDPNRRRSRLDLLAFFGEVNAGDAGIRVVGDLNIAALRIVNASNIEVSGEALGLPQVAAVNVGALTAATAAASSVVNEAARLAEQARPGRVVDLPVLVTVRLLGFGEEP